MLPFLFIHPRGGFWTVPVILVRRIEQLMIRLVVRLRNNGLDCVPAVDVLELTGSRGEGGDSRSQLRRRRIT